MASRQEIQTRPEPTPGSSSHGRRKRRRRKRRLGVPAPVVFYVVAVLATMSTGLVYLRGRVFVGFTVVSSLLILAALLINERTGFYRSRRARRPSEARDKFTMLEVAVLFALLLFGIYLTVIELATG